MLSLACFADLPALLADWSGAMAGQQPEEAKRIAQALVDRCRNLVRGCTPVSPSEREKNGAVVVGILARGLQGYIRVIELRATPDWQATPKTVEAIWLALCDATARLDHVSGYLEHPTLVAARHDLSQVRDQINSRFGPGLYVSPILVVESFLCSVCGEDYRKCAHIVNRLYDGTRCTKVATRILRAESVDIVALPEDPRCRIWPWDQTDDPPGFRNICLLTSFRPDDFLDVPETLGPGSAP